MGSTVQTMLQELKYLYTSLSEVFMMMMFELLMQTGVIIHTHTCIIMLFGFTFLYQKVL